MLEQKRKSAYLAAPLLILMLAILAQLNSGLPSAGQKSPAVNPAQPASVIPVVNAQNPPSTDPCCRACLNTCDAEFPCQRGDGQCLRERNRCQQERCHDVCVRGQQK